MTIIPTRRTVITPSVGVHAHRVYLRRNHCTRLRARVSAPVRAPLAPYSDSRCTDDSPARWGAASAVTTAVLVALATWAAR